MKSRSFGTAIKLHEQILPSEIQERPKIYRKKQRAGTRILSYAWHRNSLKKKEPSLS